MSGGHDKAESDTPCSEVLDKLYTYIDGELEESNCDEVRRHLDGCGPCLDEYGLEEAVKKLVAKHCGCDTAPPELRTRILGRLAAAREEHLAREAREDTPETSV
ncbi:MULTISPECIES: mycothiol system anti-sigma-R factor [Nocardiopsis]|jgi:mycothiol system anti-sigma-R factor|uniref:Mycothiol system anti-sigma-R factor n=2 Tax=Nocardiopsis alba TaxID=53437 RepID=A0A7K2IPY9_9ACTN|nr:MULTISPECIES: mycothiol system anti-sigma-R factor [Nocardiopsis]AFR08279.1 mycothiol system anti-sigma-R factor [Nocardiopsis alba ATCC BAA-2165]MEC3893162.1 mycothiol system anti-sigma-R factor [Nocardiopsis sp. LDBS1602]MYR31946.1 mycothiol system anti-sigma-R factor [Nocardiopsis alba]